MIEMGNGATSWRRETMPPDGATWHGKMETSAAWQGLPWVAHQTQSSYLCTALEMIP